MPENVWPCKGKNYDAFLCEVPGKNNENFPYKLFVREKNPYSERKIVFDMYFSELPENF